MFVSVVMPIYNSEDFLEEAIESVRAQTHRDLELVAVDDGSTDRSPAILRRFAQEDARVRVITQANAGGAAARNRALRSARAQWVISLDHDDVMLPHRVERQIAFIGAHPDVKVFACRAYYVDRTGKVIGRTRLEPLTTRAEFEQYLASGQMIGLSHTSVAMHRPTVLELGGYRPEFDGAEDIDLWNRVAEHGHLVLQQKETLTRYRIHETSVMTARPRQNWLACEWVHACMRARRAGRPEPSRDEFMRDWSSRPWWHRLRDESLMLARVQYRAAGFEIANRHWARGTGRLLLAGCARPGYVLRRLSSQVRLPWQEQSDGAETASLEPPAPAAPGN